MTSGQRSRGGGSQGYPSRLTSLRVFGVPLAYGTCVGETSGPVTGATRPPSVPPSLPPSPYPHPRLLSLLLFSPPSTRTTPTPQGRCVGRSRTREIEAPGVWHRHRHRQREGKRFDNGVETGVGRQLRRPVFTVEGKDRTRGRVRVVGRNLCSQERSRVPVSNRRPFTPDSLRRLDLQFRTCLGRQREYPLLGVYLIPRNPCARTVEVCRGVPRSRPWLGDRGRFCFRGRRTGRAHDVPQTTDQAKAGRTVGDAVARIDRETEERKEGR